MLLVPFGGCAYGLVEVLYRGYTHWTMLLLGGFCFWLMAQIGALLAEIKPHKIKLLPYHDYARSKYSALAIPDTMPHVERPTPDHMEACADILRAHGLEIEIG